MNAREVAALTAAVAFAGGTSTWAVANATPAVDLPPAPTLSSSSTSPATAARSGPVPWRRCSGSCSTFAEHVLPPLTVAARAGTCRCR